MKENCLQCGACLPTDANFCPACGSASGERSSRALTPKNLTTILVVAALLFAFAWMTQSSLAGKKPTITYDELLEQETTAERSELARLRSVIQEQPDDLSAWRALRDELRTLVGGDAPNRGSYQLEYMEALAKILALDQEDYETLLEYADFSFNQKVFDKSVAFYESYIAKRPDDLSAQARYASALTFLSEYDRAIAVLESVLKKDPQHFQAMAFLSVTHSQKGDIASSLLIGEEALALAPSDEARARFGSFVASLRSKQASQPANVQAAIAYLTQHPITQTKFVSADLKAGNVLELYFRDFPMHAMPDVAKQKFYSELKQRLVSGEGQSISVVHFIDARSGSQLDTLRLQGTSAPTSANGEKAP